MTVPGNLDKLIIPLVNLDDYRFSPPGSMGWSEAEYEQLITDPERTIQTNTFSPPEVPQTDWIELSLSKERAAVGSASESGSSAERASGLTEPKPAETEETNPDQTRAKSKTGRAEVYIQSPNPPALPWLALSVSGKRKS